MYFCPEAIPVVVEGKHGGDDELERADSERARKQIRMRKGFPSSRNEKGPDACVGAFEVEGMTGIEPA